jgi:hypothetical protein
MSKNEDKDNSTDSNKDNDRLIQVLNTKENNYSTFKENNISIEMNKDTTGFDLFKE